MPVELKEAPEKRLRLYRKAKLDRGAIDDKARTIELSFSSEEPVMRYLRVKGRGYLLGQEILSHEEGACDLSRLNNGHPFLVNHDDDDLAGVIESARIEDKKGRALIRFGRSARAEEIYQDCKDGIRPLVSVGYDYDEREAVELDESECDDPMDPECEDRKFIVRAWMPYEISSVPIPADVTVGVGRSDSEPQREITVFSKDKSMHTRSMQLEAAAAITTGGGGAATAAAPAAPAVQVTNDNPAMLAAERARAKAIRNVGKLFNQPEEEVERAIEQGLSEEAFNKMVLNGFRAKAAPAPAVDAKAPETRSIGERVIASQAFREYAKRSKGNSGEGKMQDRFAMEMDDVLNFRAVLVETGLTNIQKQPGVVTLGQQPLTIADLLLPGETSGITVRYIQENSFTNAATAVAENAAFPEATFDLTEIDATVRKIAVIGRISNEMNEDFPAVRSYVDGRLAFMVAALEDNHLLNGTNANNQIKGILNFAGISTLPQGGNSVADAIFLAMTKVRAVGFFEPTAIVMHPNNFASLKLTKDSAGQYLFGGPYTGPYGNGAYQAAGYVWGLPVVATTAIAAGTILVGGFMQGAQLFRRRGLTVEFSNSDASDFANDRVAIRASTRIALAVYRPLAFCTVTGVA